MPKTAVVLFNIGGPDRPEAIAPFLVNFFSDPNIIRLPRPVRRFVARRIAKKRSRGAALEAYGALGGKSPLLEHTQAQARALEAVLKERLVGESRVFVCMRYWHPRSDVVARAVAAYDPDRVLLLPLYPQFSTTTSRSSFQDWTAAAQDTDLAVETQTICCYPFEDGFVAASAGLIRMVYAQAKRENPGVFLRLLFSAHGLPETIVKSGDPYQWQCEESARRIAAALDLPDLDWQICYQSRVGPLKWIGPSTEEALVKAAADKVGVLVYPHAFVSEHVETLVEIEQQYRALAERLGVPAFYRVPTVSTHPDFISGLAGLVERGLQQKAPDRVCPAGYTQCYRQQKTRAAA